VAEYLLRPRARGDLAEIWLYTESKWGEAQADQYLANLEGCFRNLAEDPRSGTRCDEIREGYWRAGCGRHVVFFRRVPPPASLSKRAWLPVVIERVLHERMLFELHLTDD